MLTQAHLVPLTEENLKKHQRETTTKRIPLRNTARKSKSGSLRSAGDGESIKFVSDEALNTSLNEEESGEKQTFPAVELPSDSTTTTAVFHDMSKHKKHTDSPSETTTNEAEKNLKVNNPVSSKKEELSEDEEATKLSDNEQGKESNEYESENARESEEEQNESEEEAEDDEDDNSDASSDESSSADSDSDIVPAVAKNDDEQTDDCNETAGSARSSSPVSDDDDDDDDDSVDDDDDETEDEGEVEEGEKSGDELTHYTSSLNASVSSIPTLCDDREASLESPNSSVEESPRASPDQDQEQSEEQEQETEAASKVVTEGDEAKVEEEEEVREEAPEAEGEPAEKEGEGSGYTPPASRQVSGRSATPTTVVVSEFDDVESTIFDRGGLSRQGSSSRNKLTSSANSKRSDVSIKNWAGFDVTSNAEGATEFVNSSVNANVRKRLKTRKIRNANKVNLSTTKNNRTKELKQRPALKRTVKKISNTHSMRGAQLTRQSSISSDNSDMANTRQKKTIRRKPRPVKQVSFDNSNIENNTKITTSDSAFFGSRTDSRGKEKSSPKPPESEHSGRVSSRWTAAETERASSTSPMPVSTVQSPRSTLSTSQRSRQTSLVEQVTAVNYPPAVIYGKKKQLPSMRRWRHGKWGDINIFYFYELLFIRGPLSIDCSFKFLFIQFAIQFFL